MAKLCSGLNVLLPGFLSENHWCDESIFAAAVSFA